MRRLGGEADDPAQIGKAFTVQSPDRLLRQLRNQLLEHGVVVGGLERAGTHQPLAGRLIEHVFQFREPVSRVDIDQNHTDLGAGKLADKPFGTVGRPHPQPVPCLQPQGQQRPGMQVDGPGQLRPGVSLVLMAHHQRFALGVTRSRAVKRLTDGHRQQRLVLRALAVTGDGLQLHDNSSCDCFGSMSKAHARRPLNRRIAMTLA